MVFKVYFIYLKGSITDEKQEREKEKEVERHRNLVHWLTPQDTTMEGAGLHHSKEPGAASRL